MLDRKQVGVDQSARLTGFECQNETCRIKCFECSAGVEKVQLFWDFFQLYLTDSCGKGSLSAI